MNNKTQSQEYGPLMDGYLLRNHISRHLEAFSGNGIYCDRGMPGMKKFKTVKEVCALTGLTGKHLYYFHHENVVRATAYANYSVEGNDGYKLYDERAVEKLQQIALYYQLGLKRNEIRDMMLGPEYDSNKALDTLLAREEEKRVQISRNIAALNHIKLIGTKNGLVGILNGISLTELGRRLLEEQNVPIPLEKAFEEELHSLISELNDTDQPDRVFERIFARNDAGEFFYLLGIFVGAVGEGTAAHGIKPIDGRKALRYLAQHPEVYAKHTQAFAPENVSIAGELQNDQSLEGKE